MTYSFLYEWLVDILFLKLRIPDLVWDLFKQQKLQIKKPTSKVISFFKKRKKK